MDLLERATALAACSLFAELAPAVVVRLAERARPSELEAGERRTTDDHVWIVAHGALAIVARGEAAFEASVSSMKRHGQVAGPGHIVGLIRVVAPATAVVDAIAERPSTVLALALDDVRDVLEEDPGALAALADALARQLLQGAP
ncbi:MAG: cyclic nucleotide-binding domain-containing protein [Myxococcota bacterium]|nr:cyclic nucleotide-binding domain-containing protein [Myxococcota bacterium]